MVVLDWPVILEEACHLVSYVMPFSKSFLKMSWSQLLKALMTKRSNREH